MRASTTLLASSICLSLLGQSIVSGPMPGYCEFLEGIVWLQTDRPCTASMMYWKEDEPANVHYSAEATAEAKNAFAVKLIADEVEPGNTYRYRVLLDDMPVEIADTLRFHTQALWKYRTEPPDFTVAIGSCAYINEPAYDRPGKPYGDGYGIFNGIADQHPDLMLWLGDNVYLREPDWGSWTGILHRYTHTRSLPDMQRLLRSTHHVAIWDDHDFGPNDGDGSFVNAAYTRRAFELFWPNPTFGVPGADAITTMFSWNDIDFFLMDDRTFRVPPSMRTATGTILGKAQIDWLIQALKYSKAPFKLVAIGGQFLSDAAEFENYATCPTERAEIIERIHAEGITGVIFLTGDRHFTELTALPSDDGNTLYDLTVSPLTSATYDPSGKNSLSVPGTVVAKRNFGVLEFSGPMGARAMRIAILDTDGNLQWERTLTQPAPVR